MASFMSLALTVLGSDVGETPLPSIVSPSLSLSLSVGPSKVKVKGNLESLFEAETEREDAQKHWEKLKEKTPEQKKFEWRLREGVCVCGGGGSLIPNSALGGNTTLTQTGK